MRAIRVMLEVDTPSHTACWCRGYPQVCPPLPCKDGPTRTPLDPSNNETFNVVSGVLAELAPQVCSPTVGYSVLRHHHCLHSLSVHSLLYSDSHDHNTRTPDLIWLMSPRYAVLRSSRSVCCTSDRTKSTSAAGALRKTLRLGHGRTRWALILPTRPTCTWRIV